MIKDMKKRVNTNLRIGFDFDGVIIDHTPGKIKKAKELGFDIKPYQTPSNRLENIIDQYLHKQIRKYIYGGGTVQAPIVDGSKRALNILKQGGYELFIISRREPRFQLNVIEWLEKNIPGIFSIERILFVPKERAKDEVCQRYNISIYIDDKVSVLKKIKSVNKKFLFDPYNLRDDFDLGDIQPVSSWNEFLEILIGSGSES
ncbi:hypothetical protein MYX07_04035 [Patescibacteria group bacterium AH-259-L07]|nr:hypothetical protein [Patescibacteria group bacterium AH-259-L07]